MRSWLIYEFVTLSYVWADQHPRICRRLLVAPTWDGEYAFVTHLWDRDSYMSSWLMYECMPLPPPSSSTNMRWWICVRDSSMRSWLLYEFVTHEWVRDLCISVSRSTPSHLLPPSTWERDMNEFVTIKRHEERDMEKDFSLGVYYYVHEWEMRGRCKEMCVSDVGIMCRYISRMMLELCLDIFPVWIEIGGTHQQRHVAPVVWCVWDDTVPA